jgi:hypothetical protein
MNPTSALRCLGSGPKLSAFAIVLLGTFGLAVALLITSAGPQPRPTIAVGALVHESGGQGLSFVVSNHSGRIMYFASILEAKADSGWMDLSRILYPATKEFSSIAAHGSTAVDVALPLESNDWRLRVRYSYALTKREILRKRVSTYIRKIGAAGIARWIWREQPDQFLLSPEVTGSTRPPKESAFPAAPF